MELFIHKEVRRCAGVHNGIVRAAFIYDIFLDLYKRYLGTGLYRLDQIDTKEITTKFVPF